MPKKAFSFAVQKRTVHPRTDASMELAVDFKVSRAMLPFKIAHLSKGLFSKNKILKNEILKSKTPQKRTFLKNQSMSKRSMKKRSLIVVMEFATKQAKIVETVPPIVDVHLA